MLDASSTWTPQDSSNGHTQFGASDFEETRLSEARVSFRLRTFVELRPSTTARSLDLKCQIDVRFKAIKVEQLQIVSNARNVELYLARESGTFEYVRTLYTTRTTIDECGVDCVGQHYARTKGRRRTRAVSSRSQRTLRVCGRRTTSYALAPRHKWQQQARLAVNPL